MGLGSEIRDPEKPIPDPGSGSRGQKGTGSRIRNTAFDRNMREPFNSFLLKMATNPTGKNSFSEAIAVPKSKNTKNFQSINQNY
jgi:hypothetical protein